jgi:LacI family transcriptional regulator
MARTFRVALLVESSRAYGRGILRGIAAFARATGNWSIYHQEQLLASDEPVWLRTWRGDGIIARIESPALARRLGRGRLPAVDLVGSFPMARVPLIATDDRAVMQLAIDHLRERGFRHLAFCGFAAAQYSERRRQFFAEILRDAAAPFHEFDAPASTGKKPCRIMDIEAEGLMQDEALAAWLSGLPKPVGVVACNDIRGLQILNVCREHDIAVPDAVSVVGVDNDEVLCELAGPRMTSVEQNTEQIGYQAAVLLQRMMEGEAGAKPPKPIAPLGVVGRASTDVFALDDREVAAALRYIRGHASDGIGVTDVARHTGISRTSLERRMQKRIGRSPLAEINRVRLERVKQLLVETDYRLPEIARVAGFAYSEYMIAFFRQHTGQTPAQYRQSAPARD